MDINYIIYLIILVLLSGYFSATETAFSSLNKTKLKSLIEKGDKKSKRAELTLNLVEKYDKLISTILIGNNIVNIATASISTVMFVSLYGEIGATISTAVITIVVLIFGEISPKSIAKDCPERFAMFSAPYINLLIWILTPINFLFTLWKKLLTLIFRIEDDGKISSDELMMIVDEVQQDGNLEEDESELIKNAIEFTEHVAEDITTHRVDIEAVSIEATKEEISTLFNESQFSRIPVFDGTIDNIIGVIHMKDFYTEKGITNKSIKEIMTKPVFIQKTDKINDILKVLQKNKSHIAVVIDEYGGTHGIVTMEDILEELVGEIWDEHDEVVELIKQLEDYLFEVDGNLDFDEFCKTFEITCETENNSTGGWAMEQISKMPETGDSFIFENLQIKITETDTHRVMKLNVKILPKINNEENEE